MGQNRSDTAIQRSAKQRTADRTRCPKCDRGNALVLDGDSWTEEDGTSVVLTFANCRWRLSKRCDYQKTTESRYPPTQQKGGLS